MGTSGQLKAKVDRLKKKITAKGASLDPAKRRLLHKKLKRFQRARRTALALEKRAVEKAKGGKPAASPSKEKPAASAAEEKPAVSPPEEKPPGAAPEAATPAG
jgi:hypothetical protein